MAGTAIPVLHVTVTLKDIDFHDPIPERILTLRAPDWEVKIGRGTQSGFEGLTPNRHNAWFDSRVMSRSHAILRADPVTKEITIEDAGSMHGTHLAGKRLHRDQIESLWHNDTLTMGADVLRGSAYFNALRVRVTWNWSDQSAIANNPTSSHGNMYRNTFSADYSEEEHFDEYNDGSSEILGDQEEDDYPIYDVEGNISEANDELQVIRDSVRQPSIEIVMPPAQTFTVPESEDGSTKDDSSSVQELYDEASPASSPVIQSNANETEVTTKSKIVTLSTSRILAPAGLNTYQGNQDSAYAAADLNESDEDSAADDFSHADSFDDDDDELDDEFADDPLVKGESVEPFSAVALSSPSGDVPQSDYVRAPSPSDAAMVKPLGDSSFGSTTAAPPFARSPSFGQQEINSFDQPQIRVTHKCNDHRRPSTAWAGHNSVLHDHVPRPDVPTSWPTYTSTTELYPRATEYMPVYPAPYHHHAYTMPHLAQPAPPITIASLVQQQPDQDYNGSKKRKAEEMSSDDFGAGPVSSELAASEYGEAQASIEQSLVDHAYTSTANVLQGQPATTVTITENTTPADTEEPPRKKTRKIHAKSDRQGRGGIVKMAAAAITGMAIGAVGAVVGLASLPQDYFM